MTALADFDIRQLHRIFLLRDPATEAEIVQRRGATLDGLLLEFVGAQEFRLNLQAAVRERRLPEAPAWLLPARAAAGWAATALPLENDHRAEVAAAKTWPELIAVLFADTTFRREIEGVNPAAAGETFVASCSTYASALAGRALVGGVDSVAADQVLGWAVDRHELEAPVGVRLVVAGAVRAETATKLFRRDLQDVLGGSGRYGFGFTFEGEGGPPLPAGASIEVQDAASGLTIGRAVLDPAPDPGPIQRFQADVARAQAALGWLDRRAQELGASAVFPLSEYGAWARAYGRETFRAERARARRAQALDGVARITLMVSPAATPLDHAPLLERLGRQEAPGWNALLLSPEDDAEALGALLAQLEPDVRERCRVLVTAAEDAEITASALAEASGDHIMLLSGGDAPAPDAVFQLLNRLAETPAPKLVFGDDDQFSVADDGSLEYGAPRLRTVFDPELILQEDALGSAVCVERRALERVLADGASLAVARRHDLALRVLELEGPEKIARVPGTLAHLRVGGEATRSAPLDERRADVERHLVRQGSAATARISPSAPGPGAGSAIRIDHPLRPASATAIIPTRDRLDLLRPCLESLERSRGDNLTELEIVVVDNDSQEPETLAYLRGEEAAGRLRVLRSEAPFNFATLNNLAARTATTDLLVLLNNDVEVMTPGWLDALARHALRPEVGAVGARLVYEDLTLQHAGVVLGGVHELTAHEGVGAALTDGGYLQRHARTRRVSAVTGACLATRRDVWEQVGGLDAARFAVDGNDVDYCLRVQAAGLAVVYTPDATLFHHESKSRGFNAKTEASRRRGEVEVGRLRDRWGARLKHDPWYHPVFDRSAKPFQRLGPPGGWDAWTSRS